MTPEDWQQVTELFEAALEREGSERDAFIQQACERDKTTGEELRRLLKSAEAAADFLEERQVLAASNFGVETSLPSSDAILDRQIGPYRIIREIGHGGMGIVYLAERADGQYRKRVAIKIVNPYLGTHDVLRRFLNERQVLAALDHPNITRLLDGGTTEDGRPYLVMDYVEGAPITTWCDSRKLTVRERLRLFRNVCDAAQYAHDNQVIHRDIKPGNILVTTAGSPQLMDFGIAKVLNRELSAETLGTTMAPGPMTPEYASPEQIRGETIGPASDIYSLGVVLYQLLTGQLPHRAPARGFGQLARLISEQDPAKPSAAEALDKASEDRGQSTTRLRRVLAGDLDTIVLKALRKEPEARYATAGQFSDDIQRFLQNMPVRARRGSVSYRAVKFLKRRRIPVLATVAALGAVVVVGVLGLPRFEGLGGASTVSVYRRDPRWNHLKFERIATLGDPAPGGGVYGKYFAPFSLNNRGDMTFVAELPGKGDALFLSRNQEFLPLPLVIPGAPAPGGGVFEGVSYGDALLNEAGDAAFVYGLKPLNPQELKGLDNAGLYFYSHVDRKVTSLVVPGVTPAPGFGVFRATDQHASLNKSGAIVFPGVVRTPSGVLPASGLGIGLFLVDRDGSITTVVAPGDPAPGGGVFDFTYNPWINDRGDIAFGGHIAGEECISMGAHKCGESIYLRSAKTRRIESIAHQGEPAPQAARYRFAWGPVLNNRGDLAFIGELTPEPGIRETRGIYMYSRGITVPIALPGDIMPDGRKIATVNPARVIANYSLNNRGEVTFNAALENGESAMYVHSQGRSYLVAGTGTVIPGVGTISSVTNLLCNGPILNDNGQALFWATLADGRGVLLLATPSGAALD